MTQILIKSDSLRKKLAEDMRLLGSKAEYISNENVN